MKDFEHFIRHLKLEAVALAILMLVLTHRSGFSLWYIPATFLFFDIGMLGYLKNPTLGATIYNVSHNLTIPTLLIAYGAFFKLDASSLIGFCWTFHIAFDRALGYGLKHQHSFQHTHLGKIGKKK